MSFSLFNDRRKEADKLLWKTRMVANWNKIPNQHVLTFISLVIPCLFVLAPLGKLSLKLIWWSCLYCVWHGCQRHEHDMDMSNEQWGFKREKKLGIKSPLRDFPTFSKDSRGNPCSVLMEKVTADSRDFKSQFCASISCVNWMLTGLKGTRSKRKPNLFWNRTALNILPVVCVPLNEWFCFLWIW
jgi:hypothetical protein